MKDSPALEQLRAAIVKLQTRAVRVAEKALLDPDEEGFDGSGDVPWEKRSTRVAIGVMLAAKAADVAKEAPRNEGPAFGLLVIRERITDVAEWERQAQAVDVGPAPKLIEAEFKDSGPEKEKA